ncbi:magnesium-dependent phosphatase-1 [Fomitiporia mediterranea MF3/22]|uniref:magnesium-dependent phosphatase-1 n=1 Tax=Fomitiporia mediterranea (strain MF3/22) TaxID=694068 RepID=UPI00044096E1|nr:magnesium-dependent phosphatase-1 [Fomitiporia mediterranea MF3/22]EJC99515.1 magnesium-dependent phosphatase-1 [Fomitiporia mediterranea MF3/22]
MANTYPQLVAFDLDYTLWDLWIDCHVSGPLRREGDAINEILDTYDQTISFYPEVASVLHRLKFADAKIAACSRTSAPKLARQALNLLLVPPSKAEPDELPRRSIEYFDELEIYPGSKLQHFRELHRKTTIPYSQMLFFDDEHRNKEVEKLGVTFIYVPRGLDEKVFEAGLTEWRRRHLVPEPESETAGD